MDINNGNIHTNDIELDKFNILLNKLSELDKKFDKFQSTFASNSDLTNPEHKKKYDMILKIINVILTKNEKKNIKNLTELTKIERECFVNEESNKVIDENEKEIFEAGFDKKTLNWYTK